MNNITNLQEYWEKEYENTNTQFDVEQPDRWIFQLEKQGTITGNILDAGCGPGRTALYLAKLGYSVVGADISTNAIKRAQQKANDEKINIFFTQADMTKFTDYQDYFNTVIDVGCFHSLPTEKEQQTYANILHNACKAKAQIYLRAFSNKNLIKPKGIPAISQREIAAAFSSDNGWQINDLQEKQIELLVANNQQKLGYCWFATIEKIS